MQNGKIFELENVAYVPIVNSNLLSLGLLQEAGIIIYDMANFMLLKKDIGIIKTVNRLKNFFIFNTNTPKFAKTLKKQG